MPLLWDDNKKLTAYNAKLTTQEKFAYDDPARAKPPLLVILRKFRTSQILTVARGLAPISFIPMPRFHTNVAFGLGITAPTLGRPVGPPLSNMIWIALQEARRSLVKR
jgi:hypothetical protein